MINAHESGSNSPGAGTFSRDLSKTKSLSSHANLGLLCKTRHFGRSDLSKPQH